MERRLAAILAADVVGYSRLMEQDEAGTLATPSRSVSIGSLRPTNFPAAHSSASLGALRGRSAHGLHVQGQARLSARSGDLHPPIASRAVTLG